MNGIRLEAISRLFAKRHPDRIGASIDDGAAASSMRQEATPVGDQCASHGPTMLFVQSFQSGSIVPADGTEGRYTVTLEHGLGQTIYFSDRPDRIVGATPTETFLDGLGFQDDNPPNAALVVETGQGTSDLAVVELFDPVYDPSGPTLTYGIEVLANWEDSMELGFTETPLDLASFDGAFGATHLFIDDCRNGDIYCQSDASGDIVGTIPGSDFDGYCYSWGAFQCLPCQPWIPVRYDAFDYWADVCNERFPQCHNNCEAQNV